ncbi:MAG: hypothetical protein WDW38_008435 [Sanguina aurantia]
MNSVISNSLPKTRADILRFASTFLAGKKLSDCMTKAGEIAKGTALHDVLFDAAISDLTASCVGSDNAGYVLSATCALDASLSTSCTCPAFDKNRVCKHLLALLFWYVDGLAPDPASSEQALLPATVCGPGPVNAPLPPLSLPAASLGRPSLTQTSAASLVLPPSPTHVANPNLSIPATSSASLAAPPTPCPVASSNLPTLTHAGANSTASGSVPSLTPGGGTAKRRTPKFLTQAPAEFAKPSSRAGKPAAVGGSDAGPPAAPKLRADPPRAHPPLQPDSGTCSSHPRRTTQTRVNQMLRAATERSHSSTSLPALPDQLAGRDRHSPPAASHRLPRLPSPQEPLQAAPLLWPSDPDPDPEGCSFAYHRHTQPGSIQPSCLSSPRIPPTLHSLRISRENSLSASALTSAFATTTTISTHNSPALLSPRRHTHNGCDSPMHGSGPPRSCPAAFAAGERRRPPSSPADPRFATPTSGGTASGERGHAPWFTHRLPALMVVCFLLDHVYSGCETWHRMADYFDPAHPPGPPLFGFLDRGFPYGATLVVLPAVAGVAVAGQQAVLSSAVLALWVLIDTCPTLAKQLVQFAGEGAPPQELVWRKLAVCGALLALLASSLVQQQRRTAQGPRAHYTGLMYQQQQQQQQPRRPGPIRKPLWPPVGCGCAAAARQDPPGRSNRSSGAHAGSKAVPDHGPVLLLQPPQLLSPKQQRANTDTYDHRGSRHGGGSGSLQQLHGMWVWLVSRGWEDGRGAWLSLELSLCVPLLLAAWRGPVCRGLALLLAAEALLVWQFWGDEWQTWYYVQHVRASFFADISVSGGLLLLWQCTSQVGETVHTKLD